jgi:hypothetical protein
VSGSVGIGLSSPSNLLHLAGASATPSLRLGSISTEFHWDIGRENATTGDFVFNNANGGATTEKVRITTGGNVGIGTTTVPTRLTVYVGPGAISGTNDGVRLQVQSYADAARNTIVWGQDCSNLVLARFGLEWNFSTAQMNFVWRDMYNSTTGSTELMRLTGGGNVGIGTSSPNARLDLGGSYGASGEKFLIYNDNTSSALAGTKVGFYMDRFGLANNSTFVFPTAAAAAGSYIIASKDTGGTTLTARVTVLGESGNVGVGAQNPRTRLQVTPQSNAEAPVLGTATGIATFTSANTNYGLQLNSTSDGTFFIQSQRFDNNAVAYKLSLQPAGGGVRVGSATAFNDDIKFNVYGTGVWNGANIGLQNGGTGGKDWIIFSTNNEFGQGGGNLLFYNNSGPTSNGLIIYANGNYVFGGSNVSDRRLKQDIENINFGLNEIMQLSPKSYHLKSKDSLQEENQTILRKRYGFIAQEVQSILPDTITGEETETDYLGLDYNGVLTVAVKAIQELKAENDTLKEILQRNNIQ